MIKVINGTTYNTASAKKIGFDSIGIPGEPGYISITLYLMDTGDYFLLAEGPMLEGCEEFDLDCYSWSKDDCLIPISSWEAKDWVARHLSGEEYIATFGDVPE